ncbi:hypothetical protein AB0L80_14640 [Streptomyces sp. NPDC052069]|uniref:hypothetical protein n=1 Tax=Streptomyces sp. NPDC052069 TaxID=3154650 RepID=UPI0034128D29
MLQCTSFAHLPEIDALVALTTMPGGPADPPEALAEHKRALCELGEHSEYDEHAARLWPVETEDRGDLWFFWAPGHYRFTALPPCSALSGHGPVSKIKGCTLHLMHAAGHSWEVTDPLGDLLDAIARREVRRILRDNPHTD